MGERTVKSFIDTDYFDQPIGDRSKGEREIDVQTWTSTVYKGTTMNGQTTIFGVNFVDGRIKGYPLKKRREENKMYFRMVRGNTEYGKNQLVDNGDGTVTDYATGLMWQKADNGKLYDWKDALAYADTLSLAGYTDWYLPNAKELESIVGLDNYINGERTVDTGWLSKTLESADKKNIIVPFGHEPAFSCNTFHPVCLDANPENRNEFWNLLEKYGIKYYFCGHTHQYNLSSITHNGKTIQQIVCGGGGGFLQPEKGGIKETKGYDVKSVEVRSETGYLLVDVNGNRLSPKWIHVYDKNVKTKPDRLKRRR